MVSSNTESGIGVTYDDSDGTLDFNVNDAISINFGVYNITDKEYIRWADSAGIGADAPRRFTQPGLNSSVSVLFEF